MPKTHKVEQEIEGIMQQAGFNTAQAETIDYTPVPDVGGAIRYASNFYIGISAGGKVFVVGGEPSTPSITASSFDLESRVHTLEARVAGLEKDLEQLKQTALQPEGDVVVLRTVSREGAKREILGLFQRGEALDQAEVAQRLSLELMLVVDLCEELVKEGLVEYAADGD